MRKTILALAIALCSLGLRAGGLERCYLSLDRRVYVAGDNIWCSAFCLDAEGKLSAASGICYVEIASSHSTAVTAKIALVDGRGAGVIPIPLNVPTGNYRIFAYTALERCESDFKPYEHAGEIAIYNTGSSARVPGGVKVVEGPVPASGQGESSRPGLVTLACDGEALNIIAADSASVSVSIWHDDGLPAPAPFNACDFKALLPMAAAYSAEAVPEFDGEVITAFISGAAAARVKDDPTAVAIVSSPGSAGDTYLSDIDADGRVVFKTNNIYGHRDLVCEIMGNQGGYDCTFVPEDKFLRTKVETSRLLLSSEYAPQLVERSLAMRTERNADTLYEFMPKRENLILNHEDMLVYHLDDYTRFPTVQDIIIEIIPELRVRRDASGARELRMVFKDAHTWHPAFSHNVMALLDGVPVTDLDHLLSFDAMLLSDIQLYPYTYSFGGKVYEGVANFVTTKGDISSLAFDRGVRIVDFDGASYPVAYTCEGLAGSDSDLRQLLYWHPVVSLSRGTASRIVFRAPSYGGKFRAVVDGFTVSGIPVHEEISFSL